MLTKQETSGNLPGGKVTKIKQNLPDLSIDVVVLLRILFLHLHFFTLPPIYSLQLAGLDVPSMFHINNFYLLLSFFVIRIRSLVIFLNYSDFLLMQKFVPVDLAEIEMERTTPGSLTSIPHTI